MNRGDLVEFFRISTQQASADLASYNALAPQNLVYDKNQKTYRATAEFRPVLAPDDAQRFLDQLSSLAAGTLLPSTSFVGWYPPYDTVRFPTRRIATATLLRLLWAIRDRAELRVSYQSMRRVAPTARWIAPHALAFDGLRWHVRAWCHENGDFRDFVISRIQRVELSRPTIVSADDDAAWNTYVSVVLQPRPELTEAQHAAIALEYGMSSGRLTLRCRRALAFYLLRQLQLDGSTRQPPAVQPLELVNRNEMTDLLATAQKVQIKSVASHPSTLENHHE
ncbi:MAG: WYL domain-containing protein [Proteobacteria bacterium]|nr:WYL domain-containing protein [Pseudomonadota bacterium]